MDDQSNWLLVDAFSVDQAAALWCGFDPSKYRLFDQQAPSEVLAIKQMLTAAIVGQALIADSSGNSYSIIGNYSESLVTRKNLQEYAKSKSVFPAFLFDTLAPFPAPPNSLGVSTSLQAKQASQTKVGANPGGRPPEYDWDSFTMEIIRLANTPDGLPETQAELIQTMLEWFNNSYDKEPAESSVKSRISKIYKYLREGKNLTT